LKWKVSFLINLNVLSFININTLLYLDNSFSQVRKGSISLAYITFHPIGDRHTLVTIRPAVVTILPQISDNLPQISEYLPYFSVDSPPHYSNYMKH
jgi:hypothetical protein